MVCYVVTKKCCCVPFLADGAVVSGGYQECMEKLKSYGIPTYAFPCQEDGTITCHHHIANIDQLRELERKKRELKMDNSSLVIGIVPGPYDVLLGRAKSCQVHEGTQRYRVLVERYREEYEIASKQEKTSMAIMIINMVHETTGRFLKDEGDGWVEIDEAQARAKVAHSFRNLRKRKG